MKYYHKELMKKKDQKVQKINIKSLKQIQMRMKICRKNFLSLQHPMTNGGTYSDSEIQFSTEELNQLNHDIIKTSMEKKKKRK